MLHYWKRNTITTMRKLYYLIIFLITPLFVFGQISQIQSMNGDEFCSGYTEESVVYIKVMELPPIPITPTIALTYDWTISHSNGTVWKWYSNVDHRAFFTPWEGEYTVRVEINYVNGTSNNPFAAFWSAPITITAYDCGEDAEH